MKCLLNFSPIGLHTHPIYEPIMTEYLLLMGVSHTDYNVIDRHSILALIEEGIVAGVRLDLER